MARHAICNGDTGEVESIIIWEGAEWLPPRGKVVVQSDKAINGQFYNQSTGQFEERKQDAT